MTYREALERNESPEGLGLDDLGLDDLLEIIDGLPAWDYPLAEECMDELARRAGIDLGEYFRQIDDDDAEEGGPRGYDYNDLFRDCVEILRGGAPAVKFDIMTDSFQFRFGRSRDSIPAMTAAEILAVYQSCDGRISSGSLSPTRAASFDTLEEARAEFARNFSDYGRTWAERGSVFWILRGELAWIEQNEYTDDGEIDQGGDVFDFSAMGYSDDDGDGD